MPRPKNTVESKSDINKVNTSYQNDEATEEENLRYIELINDIRKANNDQAINVAFEEILNALKPRIKKIVSKFNIPGLDSNDVYQESLYALRYKAIKDYDKMRGSGEGPASFERFAVLCIRRHLATEFKSSFQNKKKVLNTAASLDYENNGNDEDLSLVNIIPSTEGNVVDTLGKSELYKKILAELMSSLSALEKEVFYKHTNGDSYKEIATKLKIKKIKSVDNALSRIKNKMRIIVRGNEEFKSLFNKKR